MGTTTPGQERTPRQEQEEAATEVTEVAPDILRMQLPIALPGLGHVNTYALCDDRGVAVVDPGLPGKASWTALEDRLRSAGYGIRDVHTVIVTHSHPDHFGGAGMLRHEAGAEVVTHRAFRTWLDPDEGDDAGPDELPEHADTTPENQEPGNRGPGNGRGPWNQETPWGGDRPRPPLRRRLQFTVGRKLGRRWMRAPEPSTRLEDADVITLAGREWVALHTPGHTHDHLCLHSPADGITLTGDHVLPTITPHISGLMDDPDPLDAFFASLQRMAELPGVELALPAHGHPFTDLAGRANDIREHHEERLDKLRAAADALGEASVTDLSHELFRKRSWGPMAESETYAHLEHLRLSGQMSARRVDGLLHYVLTEPATGSGTTDSR